MRKITCSLRERFLCCSQILPTLPCVLSACPCFRTKAFISLSNNRPIRRICDRFCLEAGFAPHTVCETDNPESVRNLIAAGLGVGFWPEYSWGLLSSPQICLLPISPVECCRDIVIRFRPRSEEMKTATDFFCFLMDYTRKKIGGCEDDFS